MNQPPVVPPTSSAPVPAPPSMSVSVLNPTHQTGGTNTGTGSSASTTNPGRLAYILRTFYGVGNHYLRWALGLVVVWLVAVIVTATAGWADISAAIVLGGIAGIFILVMLVGPMLPTIIALFQEGRLPLRWVSTIIGTLLVVGLYFMAVPVKNNPRLAVFLIVAGVALFFYALGVPARLTRVLMAGLAIAILAITAIFFVGGKKPANDGQIGPSPVNSGVAQEELLPTQQEFHLAKVGNQVYTIHSHEGSYYKILYNKRFKFLNRDGTESIFETSPRRWRSDGWFESSWLGEGAPGMMLAEAIEDDVTIKVTRLR